MEVTWYGKVPNRSTCSPLTLSPEGEFKLRPPAEDAGR